MRARKGLREVSLHDDLLDHADALIALDARRPRQANFRRAVSAAYYALFHKLIDEAVASAIGRAQSPEALALRRTMSRWYQHGRMKDVANWFRRHGKEIPASVSALLGYAPPGTSVVPAELVHVATGFATLQEERHRADYDLSVTFTRSGAKNLVQVARGAFEDWQKVSTHPTSRLFLLLMLTGHGVIPAR